MARISTIEPQKREPDRVNIHLDGEYAFSVAANVAAGLRVGQELGPQDRLLLQAEDAREGAYQQALRFLSYRARSEAEIRQYLLRRKVATDVLEQTLQRLRANHLADDGQFARAWVENRNAFRPRGQRALAWELQRKGISPPAAAAALVDLDEPALAYQAGSKRARQMGALPWVEFRKKLSGFLARRGFPYSAIAPIVSRLWNETHSAQTNSDDEVTS
jgi:regulatory protein